MSFMQGSGVTVCLFLVISCACSSKNGGVGSGGGNSVLERNNHPSRDGAYVQPTLTKAMVDADGERHGLSTHLHR